MNVEYTLAAPRAVPADRPDWLAVVRRLARTWRQRARQRRQLGAMPEYRLRDLGLSRAQAAEESGKPFWHA